MTTLVVAAPSLVGSTPSTESGTSSGSQRFPPANWHPPLGCKVVGAQDSQHDLRHRHLERDSQSSETNPAVLDARATASLACGDLYNGWQSDPFQFMTNAQVVLSWTLGYGIAGFIGETIQFMQVVENGPDKVLGEIDVTKWMMWTITPVVGATYYLRLTSMPRYGMQWWFTDSR